MYEKRDAYTVVYTPGRPDYQSGNALLLKGPVAHLDLGYWLQEWGRAFRGKTAPVCFVIKWEQALEEPPTFDISWPGVAVTRCVSLKLVELTALERRAWPCRRLESDDDWQQLLDMTLDDGDGDPDVQDFLRWQIAAYRRGVEKGRAEWWGAWFGGYLVGAAGLFRFPGGVSLEEVHTRNTHRRRGVCTELCHELLKREAARGQEAWIVAEEDSPAERIYRRLGFAAHSRLWTLMAANPDE